MSLGGLASTYSLMDSSDSDGDVCNRHDEAADGLRGDIFPLNGGHGTLEILHVTQILEQGDIPCCIVGISALKYYGAPRVRWVGSFFLLFAWC